MALSPSNTPNCSSKRIISPAQLNTPNCSSSSKKKKANPNETTTAIVLYRDAAAATQSLPLAIPKRKRNKSPGVRIVGGRIYDSENGKTCHQCRQKTMDFVVTCKKSPRDDKPCIMKYCHKCLLNRYGEKAEAASLLEDWKCPKCRGICNCSHCMKKRGFQPIGSLLYTAKANGYRSVLEMMTANGPEMITASLKKEIYNDGEYNALPQPNLLMLPSTVKFDEFKQIKLEYDDMEDDALGGDHDDGTQSSERTRDDYVAAENEEEKTDERNNGGEGVHRRRKKNWKKLARAKADARALNLDEEDFAEPVVEQGAKEDGADSNMIHEAKECGVQSEFANIGKEDGAPLEVIEGGKEDGYQPEMIHGSKDDGAKSEMMDESKEDGAPSEIIRGKEDGVQSENIEGVNKDGAQGETIQVGKEVGGAQAEPVELGKEDMGAQEETLHVRNEDLFINCHYLH
ncbi:hypothetical protein ACHQM5_026098 [Ranunculus cassubicifolius]